MNRYGVALWEHLLRYRPYDLEPINDPVSWFTQVGERIATEVEATTTSATTTIETTGEATSQSDEDRAATRRKVEDAVMARYLRFHPLDMLTDPDDPLPDSLVALVSMTNAEMTDRQPPATLPTTEAMSTATTAWLARRPREIVIPVSMIDDPQVAVWRSAGHTITTRAV